MESLFYVIMYGCLRWLPQQRTCELGYWLYDFFYEVKDGENGRDQGGTEKYVQQGYGGADFLRMFRFENKRIRSFFKTAYKLLATAHFIHRVEGATLLWTMDRFRELCTSVYDGLASDERTICDRTEHDASHCFWLMSKHTAGTETCLVAGAILFHAAHGTTRIPNKRILDEAVDDADHLGDQRGGKRGRYETLECATTSGRRTRMTAGQDLDGTRSTRSVSSLNGRTGRIYNLRSRCPNLGSFTSPKGCRRSARLLSKGTSASLERRRHN